ncbi:MAG: hypothetical protein HYY78_10435 [Betaproteobacteria bacterium]|nr:hypothetical protein [Betaproteobacteria bacterium]
MKKRNHKNLGNAKPLIYINVSNNAPFTVKGFDLRQTVVRSCVSMLRDHQASAIRLIRLLLPACALHVAGETGRYPAKARLGRAIV